MNRVNLTDVIAPAFYPVHHDINEEGHSEYWMAGGRGSCKSSFCSAEIILGLIKDPQANAIVYRRVGNTLKDSVYEQLIWAIDKLGVAQYFRCKLNPLEIIYKPTGQRILFRGADDPLKSKSIKLSKGYFKYLWFEELTEFRGMEDIRSIRQSIVRGVGTAFTFYSYNPAKTALNWVNIEKLRPVPNRLIHESTYLDVPEEWLKGAFLEQAETLRISNEMAYRNEYLGEVTGIGGQVFDNLKVREITDSEIGSFEHIYQGLDFGWYPDPAHWVKCCYNPSQLTLYIFDELRVNKTSNAELWKMLQEDKGVTSNDLITADSAEPKSIADLRSYGAMCRAAEKGPDSLRYSMRWLQSLKQIIIDPMRCQHAAREFSQYEYERTKDGEVISAYPDADNHSIDAVRYALNRIWRRGGQ